MRVKICGLSQPDSFDAAVASGADWVGFVFYAPSPRCVTPQRAAVLSARAVGGPQRVGLFVDPLDSELAAVLATVRLDVLQVYASADRAAAIRRDFGVTVWRSVGVMEAADLPGDADGVDGWVIEPKPPVGATRPGGNAVALDWSLTALWRPEPPWLLAGGLTPENVAAAIRASGAQAVDVSSGVEQAPGVKDPKLIRAFVARAKAAAADPGAAGSGE